MKHFVMYWVALLALTACTGLSLSTSAQTNSLSDFVNAQKTRHITQVPHEVLAFYYPWYGTPERQGHWVHWSGVDPDKHDIASARHYPAKGAYDSSGVELIDWHMDIAKTHGVTGFIASWWGQGTYEDRALAILLERAEKKGFKISVYWETARGNGRAQIENAVRDLTFLLTSRAASKAFLKVEGKPVIFVYGRVMAEVPRASWPAIITQARKKAGDFLLIVDGYEIDNAYLFDGVHTYNIAGLVLDKTPAALRASIGPYFGDAVKLARSCGRISCLTIIPGYDDTKIRQPGFKAERHDGQTYRVLWEEAIRLNPDWILITSWNEWHEGSEIEPSLEDGDKYIKLTGDYAPRFRDSAPVAVAPPRAIDRERLSKLRSFYAGRTIGLLPGSDGVNSYWLQNLGANLRSLDWSDLLDPASFNSRNFPMVIYAGGEHYTGTVKSPDDVKRALIRYLGTGGFLVCIPAAPWPFYYDDSRSGKSFSITSDLGLPLVMGWDQLPARQFSFHVNTTALSGLPAQAAFPRSGDLRWRPFMPGQIGKDNGYLSLAQLKDAQGQYQGDGIAFVEYKTPPLAPGQVLYVWMRMPDMLGTDDFFLALFRFISTKMK